MLEPEMWREHAAELRRLAGEASDPERRRKLLGIAAKLEAAADDADKAADDADKGVVHAPFAMR